MCAQSTAVVRALLVEDSPEDAELLLHALQGAGIDLTWQRVDNEVDYVAALHPAPDIILADFTLSGFDAPRALDLLQRQHLDVPFIVVSGSIGEETAVDLLRRGAADYLLKDRLARIGDAVRRAIENRRLARQRDEAQARMRFALEAARIGTWEADLTTGAAIWSETLEALHGMSPGSFASTFAAFLDRIHPDDRAGVQEATEKAMRDRTDSNILYRTQWPDGSLHWIRATGRTFYDQDAVPLRAAGVGFDVTELHALEEQYRQAQKMEAIGQLAGGIAHDFNNLLTAIRGYTELMAESLAITDPHQESLGEIRLAAERATSLTRQLLAFSRRQLIEPRVLDLAEVLRSMEPMLRRLIGEDIVLAVETNAAGRVRADAGQMEQVVMNLAVNARDAMPDGGRLLLELADVRLDDEYVALHPEVGPGLYVMLAVSDTGTGMSEATRARVFEPFFTTKPMGKGTGLGLATVYGIVKQSRGSIGVYSEPGQGTVFKVHLPREDGPVDDVPEVRETRSLQGSETILVVEDEAVVRDLVRKVLGRAGYRVLLAATPREAVAIAETEPGRMHLLLTDVVLPEINGRVLADRIRASRFDRGDLRVLFMSGYTDSAIVHHGVLDGGTPFLHKPFTPQVLAAKVRDVLDYVEG